MIARGIARELDCGERVAALIARDAAELGGEGGLTRSKAASLEPIREYLGATRIRDLDTCRIVSSRRRGGDCRSEQAARPCPPRRSRWTSATWRRSWTTARTVRTPSGREELRLAREDLREPAPNATSREISRLPTNDAFEKRLEAAEAQRRQELPLAAILRIARSSGTRETDLCRIRWRHLDAEARALPAPLRKHPRGLRDKDMPRLPNRGIDPLAEMLSLRVHRRPRQAEADDRISADAPGAIGAAFPRLIGRCGLRRFRLHDPRREAATRLARRAGLHVTGAMLALGRNDVEASSRQARLTAAEIARRHGFPPSPAPE